MTIPTLSANFLSEIRYFHKPVVIEFYASWCPKCNMMTPVYERTARKLNKKIHFFKVDVDQSKEQVRDLGIEVYPTFIVYHNGKIIGYTSGVLSESTLANRLTELIALC